ncbi:pilus assembly protein TadG-related protein [Brevundimonas sp. 2R-24]|uniref:Pilus assembly protein TadG-related protein n=1 Tax=Peiella sedimenti TaxID=3061083 RepID=A0ABT8SIJ0_9CAUL|nr:pilus assembly protein TadG-related protein [Caulobacteraceae bacterium XZ-24]
MPLIRSFRDMMASRRGNVAVVFALGLPLAVGGAGFGAETTYWYFRGVELQNAADVAAHAGALERRSGAAAARVIETAESTAAENGFDPALGAATVNAPPATGPNVGGDAVEVLLTQRADRFFTAAFQPGGVELRARAVAAYSTAAHACILALDPTASRAVNFSGNTSVNLSGCSVMANSTASDAVNAQGSATANLDCLISGGGVSLTANVTLTECRQAVTHAPPVADPFAGVPAPAPSGGCLNDSGATLQPGRYCSGMNLSGDVTLEPGVYYISNRFRVGANARITGTGVTLYMADGASVSLNGNSTVQLSAPTAGTYAGILFFGDRSVSGSSTFNGTNDSLLTGAIYMPRQDVSYLGNFAGLSGCTQVVARTIQWSGSSQINADCESLGLRKLPALEIVRLVE